MAGLPPQHTCQDCGEPLYLFEQFCEACGSDHHWFYLADCLECGEETDYLAGECPNCGVEHSPWRAVEFEVLRGEPIAVAKDAVPRPMQAGYRRHLGMVKGQWADYRRMHGEDGPEFHVRVFGDHYEMHPDEFSAIEEPAMHAFVYAPRVAATAGIGMIRGVTAAVDQSTDLVNESVDLFEKLTTDPEDP